MNNEIKISIDRFVVISKAFSDSNRIRAFMALRKGERCVCQIIELLGLAPSTVSKHMSILKQAGLVDTRKDSRWVYYRLADKKRNCDSVSEIIKQALSLLSNDEQIINDDSRMDEIILEGSDTLCKK